MSPEIPDLEQHLLYRDGLILVLNKPAGIAVHAANGGRRNLEKHFEQLRFGLPNNPLLAHRLDRGTSGCLLLARNVTAARKLTALFADRKIQKTYVALVHGQVQAESGLIDISLSKLSDSPKHWWMKADPNGTHDALTEFKVLSRTEHFSFLELVPHTGRTHQLRVHCQHLGHPIVGDYIYGVDADKDEHQPLCLHAHTIDIPLYENKPNIKVIAPLPAYMMRT